MIHSHAVSAAHDPTNLSFAARFAAPHRSTPIATLLGTVSLAAIAAYAVLAPSSAFADGGNGSSTISSPGGVGGVDGSLASATGQNGTHSTPGTSTSTGMGGGGGVDLTSGNGAPGGARGTYGTTVVPGVAGATGSTGLEVSAPDSIATSISGGNGGAGATEVVGASTNGGGGGGGAGIRATVDVTVTGTGNVTGGTGGTNVNASGGGGGVGVFSSADVTVESGGTVTGGAGGGDVRLGGGGGGGAAAIVLTNGGTVENSGALTGGAGGQSRIAGGGHGGAGVQLLSGGTVINIDGGTITGGDGGRGFGRPAAATPTFPGDGGAGIKGAGITVINGGTITGGVAGVPYGGTSTPVDGQAIVFTGGVNALEIWSTSNILGNVTAFSAADTFKLGGGTDATFDLAEIGTGAKYDGFGLFEKVGASTWTLTGMTAAATPWTVREGTLIVDTILGGTMQVVGGRLGGTGTVGDATNFAGGTIAPGNSIGVLTVNGDYVGAGGTLEIEAELGDDSSPADLLVITGDTSGSTNVRVINVGGAGAQTVGGIRIVDVQGASNGNFALLGNYVIAGQQAVVAGAYAYGLYQGTPTVADGDWYLRSAPTPTIPSPTPGPTPTPTPTPVTYQPGVPIYEAYAGALQNFNQLDTLQRRLGNRSWMVVAQGADAISEDTAAQQGLGIWARIEAAHGKFDPETTTSGTSYDATVWKLQTGFDTLLHEAANGQVVGGLAVHYGTISADAVSAFGNGSIDTTGVGAGATLTWYGDTGFYVDGQAQVTFYDSDLFSDTAHLALADGNDGVGYAASVEAGKRIPIDPLWAITPQAQLAWSSIHFDTFDDAFGATVSLDDGDTLIGRLGVSIDRQAEWQNEAGSTNRSHVYGVANLYYDFARDAGVDVAGTPFASGNEALWGGVGFGGVINWADDRYSLYGEALAKTSLDEFGDSYGVSATTGFRISW